MNLGIDIDLREIEQTNNSRMKTLFVSCVGSHMWGMQSPESDIDLVMIYIAPTKRILRGERIPPTIRQEIAARGGEVYDTLGWEIGHLINQLIKGNVNAIWYVTSPLIIKPSPHPGGTVFPGAGQPLPGDLSLHQGDGGKPDQIRGKACEEAGQRLQDGSPDHQFRN